jgi:hypothetical protein
MSDIEQEIGWMRRSPYTEGWRTERYIGSIGVDGCPMVSKSEAERKVEAALSDAERLQRTLEDEDSRWANIYAQKCTEVERLREALRRIHAETDVPTTNPYPRETIREIARAALNREGEGK